MTADDLRKLAETKPVVLDVRLEKYVEWVERDCQRAALSGKYYFKVNYTNDPLPDEFVLKLQNRFISDGCVIIPNEDITKFREFIIDWTPIDVPVERVQSDTITKDSVS